MTEQSIKAQEVNEALKLLKAVKRVTKELLQDIKQLEGQVTPYEVGQKVKLFWAGKDRVGIVVDPLVNYNHALAFTPERCEPACIIRFEGKENKETHYGQALGIHEVIPHREIKGILK